jgi:restriction system protein
MDNWLYIFIFIIIVDIFYIVSFCRNSISEPTFTYRQLTQIDMNKICQKLDIMNGRDFELFCGFLFEKLDYSVEVTSAYNDYGKDIILNEDIYVECKRWSGSYYVGRVEMQKLIGSCASDSIKNAIFVAWNGYNSNGLEYAERLNNKGEFNLVLYDRKDVIQMIKKVGTTEILQYLGYSYKYWDKNHLQYLCKSR